MTAPDHNKQYVTFKIGDQLFGIPIEEVQDVFKPARVTIVPLAHANIAGVLNLRGRIVTIIDCRRRLGLPSRSEPNGELTAVGVEREGTSYGLLIDQIGDVMSFAPDAFEENPANLDAQWRGISRGIYRLSDRLLIVASVTALLNLGARQAA